HRRLRRARGRARQIRAPASERRGHVPSGPLRPHGDRERGSDGGEMTAPRTRFAILAASLVCVSALAAAGWWIASLGPAPLGKEIVFSTRVVDRDGRLLRA